MVCACTVRDGNWIPEQGDSQNVQVSLKSLQTKWVKVGTSAFMKEYANSGEASDPPLASENLEDSVSKATEKSFISLALYKIPKKFFSKKDTFRDGDTLDDRSCRLWPGAPHLEGPSDAPRRQGGEAALWMPDTISFSNSVLTFELKKSVKLIPTQV